MNSKAIFALCVLALLAAPVLAMTNTTKTNSTKAHTKAHFNKTHTATTTKGPFCHKSGYSNITDCKAAYATKLVLYAKAAKELKIKVTPTGHSCTECGKDTFTVIQKVTDAATWKKYDTWEHDQTEYKMMFVDAKGMNKGRKSCKADGLCSKLERLD